MTAVIWFPLDRVRSSFSFVCLLLPRVRRNDKTSNRKLLNSPRRIQITQKTERQFNKTVWMNPCDALIDAHCLARIFSSRKNEAVFTHQKKMAVSSGLGRRQICFQNELWVERLSLGENTIPCRRFRLFKIKRTFRGVALFFFSKIIYSQMMVFKTVKQKTSPDVVKSKMTVEASADLSNNAQVCGDVSSLDQDTVPPELSAF